MSTHVDSLDFDTSTGRRNTPAERECHERSLLVGWARGLLMPRPGLTQSESEVSLNPIPRSDSVKMKMPKACCKWMSMALLVGGAATGCGPMEPGEELAVVKPQEEVGEIAQRISYGGHDYLFVNTPKTWDQADSYCRTLGYTLVTINDASEGSFLHGMESSLSPERWWIGYNDRGSEGFWVWSGSPSTYSHWGAGQPDNAGNEDCATDNFKNGDTWNDDICTLNFPFICESNSVSSSNRGSFTYSASNTASATQNTTSRSVNLFAGQVFTVGTCGVAGASGSGDTLLRVLNPSGQQVAANDDSPSCGLLSNLSFVVPVSGTYTIQAGCYSSASCSGTVAYNF